MLGKCRRDQWAADDLDWDLEPPDLSREKEEAVVQYFTDMAGIELLAAALFEAESHKTDDPVLREVFESFVVDERRHSVVARRLARFYDVHHYRAYRQNRNLKRFAPHFVAAIKYTSPEIANAYITVGEILLDVALLRSLDDYVDDEMSHAAMRLVNRDESRHIAVDFHMVEHYSSDAYVDSLKDRPRQANRDRLRAWWHFGHVLFHAKPFFHDVFFAPMRVTDPRGRRLLEAFKRVQLVSRKPEVRRRPFLRFMTGMQDLYNHPVAGPILGPLLLRIVGIEPRLLAILYTPEELLRAYKMSIEELGEETLGLKLVT